MKRFLLFFYLILFSVFCFAKQSRDIVSRCEDKEIIAILDFEASAKDMSSYIDSQLAFQIFEKSKVQLVTRSHMDKVEKELKFQSSGLVSESTALSIGERLGANKIIFGTISELNNEYVLEVKMLSVETGAYALFKKYEVARSLKT